MPTQKNRVYLAQLAFAERHKNATLVEFPDWKEPEWWSARVERLYRETIVPRLESLPTLTATQQKVLAKARAYLAAAEGQQRTPEEHRAAVAGLTRRRGRAK